jgi:DNA mismatch endonuclease (patch repair protein)
VADNMTPAQRSLTMSRIRSRDTKPELTIRRLLHGRGLRYRKHVRALPGQPDLVFSGPKVAVFIDGDFWHGWKFSQWKENLGPYWREKIEGNMRRDTRNFRQLRQQGWTVIRLWEHEIEANACQCADRVEIAVRGLRRSDATVRAGSNDLRAAAISLAESGARSEPGEEVGIPPTFEMVVDDLAGQVEWDGREVRPPQIRGGRTGARNGGKLVVVPRHRGR